MQRKRERLQWLLQFYKSSLHSSLCMILLNSSQMGFTFFANATAQIGRSTHGYSTGAHQLNSDRIDLLKLQPASIMMAGRTVASMAAAATRTYPLLPALLACALVLFMKVEYTMAMVMPGAEPRDLGFQSTTWLHRLLANHPPFNSALAACNTGFVAFQVGYILWTFFVDGRKRPAIAALFMYTFRAFLGCATQLPVPRDFLGSGLDFPVGNTSFFLFFSGHVAGSVIVSIDMRRMQCCHLALVVNILNTLQSLRLLATRGHYTIDLAVGAGAGWVCDLLAGKYEETQQKSEKIEDLLREKEYIASQLHN